VDTTAPQRRYLGREEAGIEYLFVVGEFVNSGDVALGGKVETCNIIDKSGNICVKIGFATLHGDPHGTTVRRNPCLEILHSVVVVQNNAVRTDRSGESCPALNDQSALGPQLNVIREIAGDLIVERGIFQQHTVPVIPGPGNQKTVLRLVTGVPFAMDCVNFFLGVTSAVFLSPSKINHQNETEREIKSAERIEININSSKYVLGQGNKAAKEYQQGDKQKTGGFHGAAVLCEE